MFQSLNLHIVHSNIIVSITDSDFVETTAVEMNAKYYNALFRERALISIYEKKNLPVAPNLALLYLAYIGYQKDTTPNRHFTGANSFHLLYNIFSNDKNIAIELKESSFLTYYDCTLRQMKQRLFFNKEHRKLQC